MRCLLRAKIHRAVITDANPEYIGSITIDEELLKKVDIWPGEKVLIADVDNGARFETYVVAGKPGSGTVCVNGSAAKLVNKHWLTRGTASRARYDIIPDVLIAPTPFRGWLQRCIYLCSPMLEQEAIQALPPSLT